MPGHRLLPLFRREVPLARVHLASHARVTPPEIWLSQEFLRDIQARVVHRLGQPADLDQLPQIALSCPSDPLPYPLPRRPPGAGAPHSPTLELRGKPPDPALAALHRPRDGAPP